MSITKEWEVTVKPKFPAYGDTGRVYEVVAKNRQDAVSQARKLVARECAYDRHDGPLIYTATRGVNHDLDF